MVTSESVGGVERTLARAVIDATGTWVRPNPIGADGRPAVGEGRAGDRIVYGIPDVDGIDRLHYAGRRVAVVGSGHSAQNAIRDLARLVRRHPGTEVTWLVRRARSGQMFGGKADDQLPERGRLGADAHALVTSGDVQFVTGFRIAEVLATDVGTVLVDETGRTAGPFDQIVAATGFRPDLGFLSELRLDVDPTLESARVLAPLIDPNVHSCGSAAPRRRRTRPSGAGPLHRRRQELRPGAELPARHGLRTGPLRRRPPRRRSRRCPAGPPGPARNRRLLARSGSSARRRRQCLLRLKPSRGGDRREEGR